MGMGKRSNEVVEEVATVDADAVALAERKAAKRAKKAAAAAAAEVAVVEPEAEEQDVEAAALAAKKAAKKAKKAAAAAAEAVAVEPEVEEQDVEAAALAAKKAAKKAKKAAAAAAAAEAEEVVAEEDDAEAQKAARKAAKKAEKVAAAAAAAAAEDEAVPKPKAEKVEKEDVKKAEAAKDAAAGDEEWKDNTYKCIDCSEDWVDTADDQQFRYDKGFAETPKRCKDCRWAKKVRMEGGDPAAKGKGKKGKAGGDENTVFVRGLPFSATEEALTKDFSECGELVSLRMPLNDEGSCRGIAFIKYTSKEGMDKAMAFNETDYGGRTIFVTDAAIKPDGKGKGKDGKGKGKGKDGKDGKGKGKKGKKGKASSEAVAKNTGAMVESTGKKTSFDDSDDE